MGTLFRRFRTKVIDLFRKLLSLRATPHQIAVGFAIGVFIGIFPTFGLGGLAIFALATVWKFNVAAALLGTLIGNPILAPFWIGLSCLVTGISPSQIKVPHDTLRNILAHYGEIGGKYLLGNGIVSLIAAIISYFILLRVVAWYRQRKNLKEHQKIDESIDVPHD